MKDPTSAQVERALRKRLVGEGYALNKRLPSGALGADVIARRGNEAIFIEVIGFDTSPPRRSKDFYESFFRAVSRLNNEGATSVVIALPSRFARGLKQRANHYGVAWGRIANAFPELSIWLIDTEGEMYQRHSWGEWLEA